MKQGSQYEQKLTNEELLKRFTNQFDLVRYAIRLAENAIRSGKEIAVDTDSQNLSFQILSEIAARKEKFQELPPSSAMNAHERGMSHEHSAKEAKKERKSRSRAASKSFA
jgi:hypothetical protein